MKKIKLVKAIVRYTRIKNSLPRYLLLQKADDKFFPENIGKWECVGGLVKKGETPEKTIMRELKEETNLEGRIVKQFPAIKMKDNKYHSHCYVYLISSSNSVKLSKEHLDYRWVKAEDVKNMNLVLYAGILLEFFNNPEKYFN